MIQWDTTYLSKQKIADNAVLLTYANITIWHGAWSLKWWWLHDLDGDIVSKALISIKNLTTINSTNVLQLKNSQLGGEWLFTLLQQWQTTITQSQMIATSLQSLINQSQWQIDGCTTQKTQADELYRKWLTSADSKIIEEATMQAQQASTCISSASVSVKSFNGVLLNLQSAIVKTQKYITLVSTNQSLVMQYNDLLEWEIPAQLVQFQKDFQAL
jgi:hypothetical protein